MAKNDTLAHKHVGSWTPPTHHSCCTAAVKAWALTEGGTKPDPEWVTLKYPHFIVVMMGNFTLLWSSVAQIPPPGSLWPRGEFTQPLIDNFALQSRADKAFLRKQKKPNKFPKPSPARPSITIFRRGTASDPLCQSCSVVVVVIVLGLRPTGPRLRQVPFPSR